MDSYTRQEQYLNGILNGTDVPEPYTREEQLLYEIAQGGGGASAFIATFSVESDELVCDKTIDEIITAYENGDTVIGKYTYEDIPLVWQLSVAVEDSGDKFVEFYTVYAMDEGNPLVGAILGIVDDGADVWIRKVPTEIPSAGQIQSGDTGYATGGDVYTALSSKQDTLPSGTNTGDMLVWTNSQWSAQSIYGIKSDANGYYIEV